MKELMFIGLYADGKLLENAYGQVLYFKTPEHARTLGAITVKRLERAKAPRKPKAGA